MKYLYTFFFVFAYINLHAQTKTIKVIDRVTNLPLSKVSAFLVLNKDGTLTNEDGNFKLKLSNLSDTLILSCVGYETRKVGLTDLENTRTDTLQLSPSTVLLNEVQINWIDLKKKFIDLLKNYNKYYITYPVVYECTYKENSIANGKYNRITQVQLKWYDKSYGFDFNKPFDEQNKISLVNIDYSKVLNNKEDSLVHQGQMENFYLFKLLHLNFYAGLINEASEISIKSIENYPSFKRVTFNSPVVENDTTVMFIQDGVIDIDNTTGAIIGLDFNNIYNNQIKNLKSENKKNPVDYTSEIKSHHIVLTFKKYNKEKLIISSFKSDVIVEFNIPAKKNHSIDKITQEFLITSVKERGKIPKKEQIDLNKPFYENFQTNKNLDSKILLTKEEQDFINQKD